MTPELSARQTVPMTKTDKRELHRSAADLEISPGLLARALIRAGLSELERAEVAAHIAAESQAAQDRWSRAGRKAITARYAKSTNKNDGDGDDGTDERISEDGE